MIGSVSLVTGLTACGNNDDTPTPDAPISVDADPTREGTIAVTQVIITTPGLPAAVSGAGLSISFHDPALDNPLAIVHQSGGITDGCTVLGFDRGATPPVEPAPGTNEGVITVSGGVVPDPVPACANTGAGYNCIAKGGAFPDGAAVNHDLPGDVPTTIYTIPGANFDAVNQTEVGMILTVDGFAPDAVIGDGNNGSFGITAVLSDTMVAVVNPAWAGCLQLSGLPCDTTNQDAEVATATAGTTFSVVAGAFPIIGGFNFIAEATGGLCNDGTTACTVANASTDRVGQTPATCAANPVAINVSKPAPTDPELLPAFDVNVRPSGKGFTLDDNSDQPHLMPFTARDVTVSCVDTANGYPGLNGEIITGFTISGSTTDAEPAAGNPTDMPEPTKKWATFTCTFIGVDTATISQEDWQAFLNAAGPDVKRIETRFLRLGVKANAVGGADGHDVNIVAGFGYIGHSDPPAR